MLRARKYWFALCFRVLSNRCVERSAYVNVFKFNREKKRFELTKVNSRCFHWFPVAMLESLRWLQHGVSIQNPIIFGETFCRITRVRNIAHPRNFGTLFVYYSSTIFKFLDSIYWMVSDFIFHLRDSKAYLRDVKTTNTSVYLSEKNSTSVLPSGYVCSYINTNDLFQYQTKNRMVWYFFSRMLFVRVLCKEYHVKQNVLVDSLDHIYDKMPKLLKQYEWYS